MYRVQIEVTTQQSERIHLERESYSKAEECRLFSGAKRVVATLEADLAARRKIQRTWTQARRESTRYQWDLVCAVDRLPVEGGASGLVRCVQHNPSSALSGMAAYRDL